MKQERIGLPNGYYISLKNGKYAIFRPDFHSIWHQSGITDSGDVIAFGAAMNADARMQILAKALREIVSAGANTFEKEEPDGLLWTTEYNEQAEIALAALAEAGITQEKV